MDEQRCAYLIEYGRRKAVHDRKVTMILPPAEYEDEEVRVANEAMARLGLDLKFYRGTITHVGGDCLAIRPVGPARIVSLEP